MQLNQLCLRTLNPESAIAFYTEALGMILQAPVETPDEIRYPLCFTGSDVALVLVASKKSQATYQYNVQPYDNYWKYSLFVEDIRRTYRQLLALGHPINSPFQLGTIGFLAHTADRENYAIEFIQKRFEQHNISVPDDPDQPLLETPVMGLITLRTSDPLKSIRFYECFFNLKLMVRMYVNRGNGFTLYF